MREVLEKKLKNMCSFTVTNKDVNLNEGNDFSSKRGPDYTRIEKINKIQFLHNLLHITGDHITQPFINDDIVCVFNGEIYNYKNFGNYKSDGECIIDLYKKYGLEFAKKLDGEFAICIVDFKKSYLILINDTFATKPLWLGTDGIYWGVASYESSLRSCGFSQTYKMIGNHIWCLDLNSLNEISKSQLVKFNLKQHKTNYKDWITAFENSVFKRTKNTSCKIFLGLSAGYDSGAISLALNNQKIKYKAYTILSNEDINIINQRHSLINSSDVIKLTQKEYNAMHNVILNRCEDFKYQDRYKNYNIKNDKASVGLGFICSKASKEGYRIYLSGQGADEIISDYGFNGNRLYDHSSFGGYFPDNLEGFFPWHSFYDGTQVQYLNKEEYVAGAFGIETRYPFLDTQLVQEFLWLTPELKNKRYKAPLDEYLFSNNFPFQRGIKTGFQANKNLI